MDRVERLIAELSSSDAQTRLDAAVELGDRGDSRAVEPLTKALDDPHSFVRVQANEALWKLGQTEGVREPPDRDSVIGLFYDLLMFGWHIGAGAFVAGFAGALIGFIAERVLGPCIDVETCGSAGASVFAIIGGVCVGPVAGLVVFVRTITRRQARHAAHRASKERDRGNGEQT